MSIFVRKGNKIIVRADVPAEVRRQIGKLLNQCMKDYDIKGKDKHFDKAFKDIFKSNLYNILDKYFKPKTKPHE